MAACDAVPDARARARARAPTPPRRGCAPTRTPRRPTPIVPVAGKPVLWGYVDGAGMAHFATSQIDSRYDQVLRETDGRRVLGKTQGTDGLLTWLEISPDVKALQPRARRGRQQHRRRRGTAQGGDHGRIELQRRAPCRRAAPWA